MIRKKCLILEKSRSISKVQSGLKKYSHHIFVFKFWYYFDLKQMGKQFSHDAGQLFQFNKFVLRSMKTYWLHLYFCFINKHRISSWRTPANER